MRILTHDEDIVLLGALADQGAQTDGHAVPAILPTSPHRWKQARNIAGTLLMIDAGLRVGELAKLPHNDLYFNEQPVTMLHLSIWVAKRKRERDIPISPRLAAALTRYNAHPYLYQDFPITGPAFPATPKGSTLSPRQWQRILNAAGQRSIGLQVHPHMLRHTFGTRLMAVTDMRTVQELLGHEHLSSTQIYTHPTDDQKHAAINAMYSPRADIAPVLPTS